MDISKRTYREIDLERPPKRGVEIIVDERGGTTEWLLNGALHREDGPARIWEDGSEEWCVDGYYHREDGPAFIDTVNDEISWFINNVQVKSYEEFQKATECSDDHIVFLKLKWGEIK